MDLMLNGTFGHFELEAIYGVNKKLDQMTVSPVINDKKLFIFASYNKETEVVNDILVIDKNKEQVRFQHFKNLIKNYKIDHCSNGVISFEKLQAEEIFYFEIVRSGETFKILMRKRFKEVSLLTQDVPCNRNTLREYLEDHYSFGQFLLATTNTTKNEFLDFYSRF